MYIYNGNSVLILHKKKKFEPANDKSLPGSNRL